MNKLNFYSGQNVTPSDMNMLQNFVEDKENETAQKILGYGVAEGFDVVPNSPSNLSVIVTPGFGIDHYGRTLKMLVQKIIQLDSFVPSSNSRYVSVCVKFARKEYDTRLNDIGEEIKYRLDEDVEIVIIPGDVSSTPSRPLLMNGNVLLADILLSAGQTQISSTNIDELRKPFLVSLLAHQTNKQNPHNVKMSQLGDCILPGDMNANGKKITGLPAPSSGTEPVRKTDIVNLNPTQYSVWFDVLCNNGDGQLANVSVTIDRNFIVLLLVSATVFLPSPNLNWMTPSLGFRVNNDSTGFGSGYLHTASAYFSPITTHFINSYSNGTYVFSAWCDSAESQTVRCRGRFSVLILPVL